MGSRIDLGSFLRTNPANQGRYFCTLSSTRGKWRNLRAWNEVGRFEFHDPSQIPALHRFVMDHREFLIASAIPYELGYELLGLKGKHGSGKSARFIAFADWEEFSAVVPAGSALGIQWPGLAVQESRQQYRENVLRLQDHIRDGNIYQANYTHQLAGRTDTEPRDLFQELYSRNPATCAAYFEDGEQILHSLSPELFCWSDGIQLVTEPIKGTRPRSNDPARDNRLRDELRTDPKERAELAMITDLLRNDLGKICRIGSVRVAASHEVTALPNVWHTYSKIEGELASGTGLLEAVLSMFPGGSITGCPKRRAMEILDDLEAGPRNHYTGSIGYLHPDGEVAFNIAIRTLEQWNAALTLGVGGGITIRSNWKAEWQECLDKAAPFLP